MFSEIFSHKSFTREKWHYGEYEVIVIDPYTQFFKQMTSYF